MVDKVKKDISKLIEKTDDLEQMIYNLNAKTKDQYKLINDRINEAFNLKWFYIFYSKIRKG
jgi:chromosome segregation ATPase